MSLNKSYLIALFLLAWVVALILVPITFDELSGYFSFAFLGLIGAIFANSTGAGGGVVFIPMFNQLGFTPEQAVATSFGIQSFGMTAGALTWFFHRSRHCIAEPDWSPFATIIVLTAVFSVVGIWLVYGFGQAIPGSLNIVFSGFSVLLGLAILATVYVSGKPTLHSQLKSYDLVALGLIGLLGGVITAWLSVGVGELLATYLILRRFNIIMAIATAVIVSAITVWFSMPQHLYLQPNVYWQVVIFAGPAAVLGGIFARTLVTWLSPRKLKLFFAFWVLIMGLSGMIEVVI
ncbi:MAG: sulfite exporter TauE/SafE family protein [Gammaproteobacteria bacterium]